MLASLLWYRWASYGMKFMTLACAPIMLASLSLTQFEHVKKVMDQCMEHVVGDGAKGLPLKGE